MSPMFESPPPTLAGIDARLVVAAVAGLVWLVGMHWIRRALDIEPEQHSFRATAPARPNVARRVAMTAGFVVLVALLFAVLR